MHLKMQEVINYAESRFSAVVLALDRNKGNKTVCRYLQGRLQSELVMIHSIYLLVVCYY